MLLRVVVSLLLLCVCGCGQQTKEELVHDGREALDKGNVKGSIVYFKNALEQDANYSQARFLLADAYLMSGKLESAEKEFSKVSRQNPDYPELPLKFAEIFNKTERAEEALEVLERYHRTNQPTSESLDLLGRARALTKDYPGAKEAFVKAFAADSTNVNARYHLAKTQILLGDNEAARHTLEELLLQEPSFAAGYELLGDLAIRTGDNQKALEVYRRYTTALPGQPNGYFLLALLELQANNLDAVRLAIKELEGVKKAEARLDFLKGVLAYQEHHYPEAIIALKRSIRKEGRAMAYYFLGLCHFQLRDFELALNQFQKVLDLNPDSTQARGLLASTLLEQKRFDDAISQARLAISKGQTSGLIYNILGSALLASGKFDEGIEALDEAIRIDPTLPRIHLKKGLFLVNQGKTEDGADELLKAVAVDPANLNSRLILGKFYLQQENFSEAQKVFKQGLSGGEQDTVFYNALAGVAFAKGENQQAIEFLEKAIDANPNFAAPYLNIVKYQILNNKIDLAEQTLRRLVDVRPNHATAMMELGLLLEMQGKDAEASRYYLRAADAGNLKGLLALSALKVKANDLAGAIALLSEAPAQQPGDLPILRMLAKLYVKSGEVERAIDTFKRMETIQQGAGYPSLVKYFLAQGERGKALQIAEKVENQHPGVPYGYKLEIFIHAGARDWSRALDVVRRGLSATDNHPLLRMEKAALFENMGETAKAVREYEEMLADHPRFVPALFALGAYSDQAGDKLQAKKRYREVLELKPDYIPALNNLAYLLANNYGNTDEALELALKAYRFQPENPAILDTLGYIFLKKGENEKALAALEKAVRGAADNQVVRLHLAAAYIAVDRKDDARKLLETMAKGDQQQDRQVRALLAKVEKEK